MEGSAAGVGAVESPGKLPRALSRRRAARIGAVAVGAVDLALLVSTLFLGSAAHLRGATGLAVVVIATTSLVVGTLLATRLPGNAMGWCLLGVSLFLGLSGVAGSISVLDYRMHEGFPFGGAAVVLQPSWAPSIVFLGLSFLLFPDGHFSSRAVRWVTRVVLAVGLAWIAGAFGIALQAILTHAVRIDRTANLLAIDHPTGSWAWWGVVQFVFLAVVGASWALWLVQQVPRYRRSSDEERHQMKWLLSGVVVAMMCAILSFNNTGRGWVAGIGVAGVAALPLSIAVGATKFHLYAIDRLISRTLAYVLLTGVVVGVYVGVVTLATKVIGFSSPVGVAASTLVAVALFNPLRKRFQRMVDRRFNRARYDAERTVSDFAARLRESVNPNSLSDDLTALVNTVFEPSVAAVWVRQEPG